MCACLAGYRIVLGIRKRGHSRACGIVGRTAIAARTLRSITQGKEVACQALDSDVYGRTVARCTAGIGMAIEWDATLMASV